MKKHTAILLILMLILTAIPFATTAAAQDSSEVTVTVDGVDHTAHIGDTVFYTYYLDLAGVDMGEGAKENRITEFEGAVYYSKDGLELLTELESDEGFPPLPKLGASNIVVSNNSPDALRYNGFSINGYPFREKKVFLQLEFLVTGGDELYIENHLINLGSGNVKLIYNNQVFVVPNTSTDTAVMYISKLIGDVDMDDIVTINDASFIQCWAAGAKTLCDQAILNGDFDHSGETNILDVTAIQRMIAGMDYPITQ